MVRIVVIACLLASVATLGARVAPAAADTVQATDMLMLHNQLRYAIGAPTIPADPRVTAAAQHHADYSSLNGVGGHVETAGLPGFTGVMPHDRVAAAGWSTTFVSEVATGGAGALAGVTQLWNAPYHRLGLMHPNAVATGWGHSDLNSRSSTVGDLVYDFGASTASMVRSPANGQVGIPTTWSGIESPNPLPSGVSGPVGYPIMLVYSGGRSVVMRGAELVTPSGAKLPIYYAPQQFGETDFQIIIPQRPLPATTTLHVRFDITVAGQWLTNEWDFTTDGVNGAPLTAQPPLLPSLPAQPAPAPAAVPSGDTGYHSRWLSESSFPTLEPGQVSGPLTISFVNAGTRTWVRGTLGQQANLGINGDDRTFSSLGVSWPVPDRPAVQSEPLVPPGGIATFAFQVRAPSTAGLWAIHLRPVIDGTVWMEDEGVYLVIAVR